MIQWILSDKSSTDNTKTEREEVSERVVDSTHSFRMENCEKHSN